MPCGQHRRGVRVRVRVGVGLGLGLGLGSAPPPRHAGACLSILAAGHCRPLSTRNLSHPRIHPTVIV
jgi:hypothetical protein